MSIRTPHRVQTLSPYRHVVYEMCDDEHVDVDTTTTEMGTHVRRTHPFGNDDVRDSCVAGFPQSNAGFHIDTWPFPAWRSATIAHSERSRRCDRDMRETSRRVNKNCMQAVSDLVTLGGGSESLTSNARIWDASHVALVTVEMVAPSVTAGRSELQYGV